MIGINGINRLSFGDMSVKTQRSTVTLRTGQTITGSDDQKRQYTPGGDFSFKRLAFFSYRVPREVFQVLDAKGAVDQKRTLEVIAAVRKDGQYTVE